MSIAITNWRNYEKGSLRGFFDVTLPGGMIVRGCKLFQKEAGNRWVGLPSERFKDKHGAESFKPIVEFTDRAASEKFRDAVLGAIDHQNLATTPPAPKPAGPPKTQTPLPIDDSDIPF